MSMESTGLRGLYRFHDCLLVVEAVTRRCGFLGGRGENNERESLRPQLEYNN